MRPAAPYPAYYCPPGVELPAHCGWPGRIGPSQLLAESPDGLQGMYWGPGYDAASKGAWTKAKDGWYVLLAGAQPFQFARMRTVPGHLIKGVQDGHVWMVPQLLRWHTDAGFIAAVPEVLTDTGWQAPAHLLPIMDRLRCFFLLGEPGIPIIQDDEAVQMAIDLLGLNYHISRTELASLGWLTTTMVRETIEAAGGVVELRQSLAAARATDGG